MKNYVLKTVNQNDEVLEESTLALKEGSMLIVKVPDGYTYELAKRTHDYISTALEQSTSVLTLHEGIKLQVLEIQ